MTSLTEKDDSLLKVTKQFLRIRHFSAILRRNNGGWPHSDEKKVNIFSNHLLNTFEPHNNIVTSEKLNKVHSYLDAPLQISVPFKPISSGEVQYVISKFPRKKLPGYDLITTEIIQQFPKKVILQLTHIFNLMLRLSSFSILWTYFVVNLIRKPKKPLDCPSSYQY